MTGLPFLSTLDIFNQNYIIYTQHLKLRTYKEGVHKKTTFYGPARNQNKFFFSSEKEKKMQNVLKKKNMQKIL